MMTTEQLEQLLCEKELIKIEFKRQMLEIDHSDPKVRKLNWDELIKDLLSLANGNIGHSHKTGYLIIGAGNTFGPEGKRELFDVGEIKLGELQLIDKLNNACTPDIPDLICEKVSINGKNLFVIIIPPNPSLFETKRRLVCHNCVEYSEHTVFIRRADGVKVASDHDRVTIKAEKTHTFSYQGSSGVGVQRSRQVVSQGFGAFAIGNLEIPVKNLIGSPKTPYSMDEVGIILPAQCMASGRTPNLETLPLYHERPDYPAQLREASKWLEEEYRRTQKWRSTFKNNRLPRLNDFESEGESETNERGRLLLFFGATDFMTWFTTNRSLDQSGIPEALLKGKTIRESFITFPYQIAKSPLANTLSSHIALISRSRKQHPHEQVIIQLRDKVASYEQCFVSSAAGYVSMGHLDAQGRPNPFVTAVKEAEEEICDALEFSLLPKSYQMIGIAASWEDLDLNVYGYAVTSLEAEELVTGHRRDQEGHRMAIPFDCHSVLSHIATNKWESIGAFNMCSALLAFFSREEVRAAAEKVPMKRAEEFLE